VQTGTIDVAIAAECIQWNHTAVAIREIGRELKVGGTLAVTHYTVPRIVGNRKAQNVWKAIWEEYSKRATGPLLDHAVSIVNTALDCLESPQHEWGRVNAQGSIESYQLDSRGKGDDDWADEQDVTWFKGYLATWVPVVPGNEIQHLWNDPEMALGGGKVRIEAPLTIVFATKKA
jgi:SAM-dependent methyltransferase